MAFFFWEQNLAQGAPWLCSFFGIMRQALA
jgi:hypothetical protein